MLDPSKLITKRMTTEDMSLLFLSGGDIMFKNAEQFENWLFVLNFPLLSKYIKLEHVDSRQVEARLDIPFTINVKDMYSSNERFQYRVIRHKEHVTICDIVINRSYPEARLLIKAAHVDKR